MDKTHDTSTHGLGKMERRRLAKLKRKAKKEKHKLFMAERAAANGKYTTPSQATCGSGNWVRYEILRQVGFEKI